MIDNRNKDIVALRKRMDKLLLGLLHNGGYIRESVSDTTELWLTNGIAAVLYDSDDVNLSEEKMQKTQAINEIVECGRQCVNKPEAHVKYYKPSGDRLGAVLEDKTGCRLMVNNDYLKLFGDKFIYKLYSPLKEDVMQVPTVFVFYFDDLVGLIMPIETKQS
ncbi:hypothetical protein [Caproicibacter fermentans]|uniref:Uncharacterized protein n=1 Tax=Caproicibacter fermentans TaxID=2576756 RepID=A0A7G8TE05_9FIRM|nr:hypothetical protein [Caproicibacter fermentans]QNK41846.1 hypothetical protein HCR03_06285 [Caproicibacter fermentans]